MRQTRPSALLLVAAAGALLAAACTRDTTGLEPAPFPNDGEVFGDAFGAAVGFQGFAGSNTNALRSDSAVKHSGIASLRVTIPNPGDPAGGYSGGAFVAEFPRDFSSYNALTFWARASREATLDIAGLGNDNTGTSLYTASRSAIPLTTEWRKYVIPIPLPAKLTAERGMFFFAEGPENGTGYDIWFDDIQFETVAGITDPRPLIPTASRTEEVGATARVTGTSVTFSVDGADHLVTAAPAYFTFASSNTSVATVGADGAITTVGEGTTNITASLGATPASGALTINTVTPPAAAAPTPTRPAAEVISLFSDAYTNVPVSTWSASYDQADVADVTIAGNAAKKYTNLVFAAAEFTAPTVNASAMTHLHVDVFTFDDAAFRVKLVDFGANGAFGGGDDSEHEVTFSATTTPAITEGAWSSLDIPLSMFAGLQSRTHLAQFIITGSSPSVYLDNIYFYQGPPPAEPTVAAPTPTVAASNVVSLFSNAYTNATVNTWSADWDQADVADVAIAGNATKKYTNLVFAGIEFTSAPVDASAMTNFHIDLWTPDVTAAPKALKIKLVDFGANGSFGGGDDVEHEITLTAATTPGLATGSWMSLDIPLSAFTGLTTRGHLAQMIISGDLRTLFVDNVYFSRAAALTAPVTAAPTPAYPAGDVVSLFSNAYTNVPVGTWSADWDQANVVDEAIAGNATKKYTSLVFAGIEFTSPTIDASAMTHFRMDIWTPDATAAPAAFKIKLVDFGANGAFGGGDDVEHEVTLTAATTPALATGGWVTLDIPLSTFAGLTTRAHLAQLIISGDLRTVWVDNVLLHR